jgi:HEAT repeat protein
VLGNIRTTAAYELLLELLTHENPHIVNWAGDALGKHQNIAALPLLVAASKRIGGERRIEAAIRRLKDKQETASSAAV